MPEMNRRSYRILDLELLLESDSKEFLHLFHRDYSWFASPPSDTDDRMTARFLWGEERADAFFCVDGVDHSLQGHPNPVVYAWQILGRMIMEKMRCFSILHAAVAARDGESVAVAAPSGTGKTTLVLKLLESGFDFLSDDVCPIHLNTRRVHPFPRSLWVSEDSSYAGRATADLHVGTVHGNKQPIGCDDGNIRLASGPCRLKSLICIDPGRKSGSWIELEAGLRREGEQDFLREMESIPGVSVLKSGQNGEAAWRIRFPGKQGLSERVGTALAKHKHNVWNLYRANSAGPIDFSASPVLTPVPLHEAVFFVIRELKQNHDFTENRESSPALLFMQLNRLLEGVSCFRLTPGKLDAMDRLIRDTLHGR